MIEKMLKVTILGMAKDKARLLSSLRENGVMHVTDIVHKSAASEALEAGRADYARVLQILEERGKKAKKTSLVSGDEFERIHQGLLAAVERETVLNEGIIALQNERERILPFGDFDPAEVKALAENVEEELAKLDIFARRREGMGEGRWCVLDYGDVMVHIFHEQDRAYYQLERLWADGTNALELDFDARQSEAQTEDV